MQPTEKQLRLARFWRRFHRLTRGRVPVIRAIEIAREEEQDNELRQTLSAVTEALNGGSTLSEAIERGRSVFSLPVIEMIKAAEMSGDWDEIVCEIAAALEEGTFD